MLLRRLEASHAPSRLLFLEEPFQMSPSGGARPSSSPHTTKNWPVQVETDPRQLNLASLSRNGQSVALTPTGVRQGTRALWQASAGPCTGTSHRKSGLCPLSPHPRSPPFTLNSLATAGPPTTGSLPPPRPGIAMLAIGGWRARQGCGPRAFFYLPQRLEAPARLVWLTLPAAQYTGRWRWHRTLA